MFDADEKRRLNANDIGFNIGTFCVRVTVIGQKYVDRDRWKTVQSQCSRFRLILYEELKNCRNYHMTGLVV